MRMHGYGRNELIEVGRRHWKEYLPKKYKSLKASGELEKELAAAVDLTLKEMEDLKSGLAMRDHEAWEVAREHFLILKEEKDERRERMPVSDLYAAISESNRIAREEKD